MHFSVCQDCCSSWQSNTPAANPPWALEKSVDSSSSIYKSEFALENVTLPRKGKNCISFSFIGRYRRVTTELYNRIIAALGTARDEHTTSWMSLPKGVKHFFLRAICLTRRLPGCFGKQEGKELPKAGVDYFLLFIYKHLFCTSQC